MLRNAHERECKLGKEVEDSKIAEKKHAVKISTFVKENQELTNKFKFIKEKFENSLKENQEIFALKEDENTGLKKEISELKGKLEKEYIKREENSYKVLQVEDKLRCAAVEVEDLEKKNNCLKIKTDDLKIELVSKNEKLNDLEAQKVLTNSARSLNDELVELQ